MRTYYNFKIDFTLLGDTPYIFDLGNYCSAANNLPILNEKLAKLFAEFVKGHPEAARFKSWITTIFTALSSALFERVWLTTSFVTMPQLQLIEVFFDTMLPEYAGKVTCQPPHRYTELAAKNCDKVLAIELGNIVVAGDSAGYLAQLSRHFPMIMQARFQKLGIHSPHILSGSLIETLMVTNKYWFRKLFHSQLPVLWQSNQENPITDRSNRYIAKPVTGECGQGILIGTVTELQAKSSQINREETVSG